MKNEQIVVVHDKTDTTIVKLAKILALLAASPFIFMGSIVAIGAVMMILVVLIGSGAGVFQTVAPWLVALVLLCALAPALQSRISGKRQIIALKSRIQELELELSETRLEVLKAHETAEFHRRLNETKVQNSEAAKIKITESAKEKI
ncbi:MAG: hypothetical protein U0103_02010 [Candidatus Obscuribacterales bacterium]|nr:hypothetical protein [Cyanobacteria bacterium SZAS LIN-5]RTL45146.1 MAG: hypothetical protein EKK48_03565 [Candidatus Melainabacteria bacterium]